MFAPLHLLTFGKLILGKKIFIASESSAEHGYEVANAAQWCNDNAKLNGRNGCMSDEACLANGRALCDPDPECFGVAWYQTNMQVNLKLCRSTSMVAKTDGWRTMMKKDCSQVDCESNANAAAEDEHTPLDGCREVCEDTEGCNFYVWLDGYGVEDNECHLKASCDAIDQQSLALLGVVSTVVVHQ